MPKDMGYISSNNGANSSMYPEVKKQYSTSTTITINIVFLNRLRLGNDVTE